MSVCDEGWAEDKAPFGMCPAFFEPFENEGFCELGVFDDHKGTHLTDTCPFAAILKALPSASDEQIRRMTAIAEVVFECRYCVNGITNSSGMTWCMEWTADQPLDYVCAMWTRRDKEA